MLCALTGILYGRLTGRRLIVDWTDSAYSSDGSNVFHRFLLCPGCMPADEIPVTDSVRPIIWRGHLRESSIDMHRHYGNLNKPGSLQTLSVDLTKLDYEEDILVMMTFT